MKKIILLGILLSTSVYAEDSDRLNELSKTLKEGSFTPTEKTNLPDVSNSEVILKEKNIDADKYFLDWNINCNKDRFNGIKSCSLSKAYKDIMVSIINDKYVVYIGRNHFPRTSSAIKIDGNATITGYEGVSKAPEKVIEQMKKGKVAYTRYKEWPYEYNKDGEVELEGFAKKLEEMKSQYKEL